MHTLGESEHFCTDTLRKLFALLTTLFQTLACLFQPFQILMTNWYNLVEMTGPEEALKQLWILFTESNVS